MIKRNSKITRRKLRTRSKTKGTSMRPRLTVFRSSNHIYAQIIDDSKGKTLVSFNDFQLKIKGKNPIQTAEMIGDKISQKAKLKKITKVVFDRGGYKYHGRVKAVAQAARKAGLKF